ncbi:MAG: hypothetical protein WAM04_17020 [Candidatus Sulfotelmatobacter sp.]
MAGDADRGAVEMDSRKLVSNIERLRGAISLTMSKPLFMIEVRGGAVW